MSRGGARSSRWSGTEVVMPGGLYDDAEVVRLGEVHASLDVCGGGGVDGIEGHADSGVAEAEGRRGSEIVLLPVDLEHVSQDGISEDGVCPLGVGTSSRETVAELRRGNDADQVAVHHRVEHCELHHAWEQRIAGLRAALRWRVACSNHTRNQNIKSKNVMPGTHRSQMSLREEHVLLSRMT